MDRFFVFSKGLLVLTTAAFIALCGYLAFTHPTMNYRESSRIALEADLAADAELADIQEWRHHSWADIDVQDDAYPIVALRDSFKVLRLDSDTALVGWRYELFNTSPKTTYTAQVEYTLQDTDGFSISTDSASKMLRPGRYHEVSGTMSISRVDVRRLGGTNWQIGLSPDWRSSEANTQGTKYERLAELLNTGERAPAWIYQEIEARAASRFDFVGGKWNQIASAYREVKETEASTVP